MFRKRLVIIAAIIGVTTFAAAQAVRNGVATARPQSHESPPDLSSILGATPERLSREFRRHADQATAPKSTPADRRALAEFLRTELLTYLSDAVILYPLADSLGGTGGYAVASAIFDGEAIARQTRELERLAGTADGVGFRAHTLVVAELVDVYFTKERLLILPILTELGEDGLRALAGRIAAGRP